MGVFTHGSVIHLVVIPGFHSIIWQWWQRLCFKDRVHHFSGRAPLAHRSWVLYPIPCSFWRATNVWVWMVFGGLQQVTGRNWCGQTEPSRWCGISASNFMDVQNFFSSGCSHLWHGYCIPLLIVNLVYWDSVFASVYHCILHSKSIHIQCIKLAGFWKVCQKPCTSSIVYSGTL